MTLLFFFVGLGLLYAGGELLVRAAAALGKAFKLSPLVAGLTIVAFATSAPELSISVNAAINNLPGLAVGNVIGSNICNLALILGIVALVKPAPVRDAIVRRDVLVLVIATLLVPGLLLDRMLERTEGVLLLACIAAYIVLTVWHARLSRADRRDDEHSVPFLSEHPLLNLALAAAGVGLLVLGSRLFVDASATIAAQLGVPDAVVGLSAAALGSSLPELSASIIAARHNQADMAAGNLIGSNIFNLLLILGATAVLHPLPMEAITAIDVGTMILVTGLALVMMLTRARLSRIEGGVLVSTYVVYMGWLFIH
jgi:cation:H+ antiporter